MLKIAIVDDMPNIRQMIRQKLAAQPDVLVLFTASNGRDFLEKMKTDESGEMPDVVLMDLDMPELNGIETIAHASVLYPDVRFLVLTVFDDDEKIFDAIKVGAGGYLLKDDKLTDIVAALQELVEFGGVPMSPQVARKALRMLSQAQLPAVSNDTSVSQKGAGFDLTKREIEILSLMVDGKDSNEIASQLFLRVHTVRKHIANIYNKLHVCSRVQAIKVAIKNNWV
ncbi:MAG TPA: response regulator transcription factor [Phnomibacter sp.]|nr:response regulator transcription factor [Phnomibacter sp.]